MIERFALPLMALAAVALIALSLVWPQGQGRPSPAPFGHPLARPAPAARPPVPASPR
jgi:hypothetical protein